MDSLILLIVNFIFCNLYSSVLACTENTCGHHGICENMGDSYKCNCDKGFIGKNCELQEEPCDPKFSKNCLNEAICSCRNQGICVITGKGFECNCTDGFTGPNCEHEIHCTKKCLNGGTCSNDDTNNHTCSCLSTFYGSMCQLPIACKKLQCLNGGACTIDNKTQDTFCNCPLGYDGKYCEQADLCILNDPKCENNGICSLKKIGFEMATWCKCNKQFEGPKCEKKRICFGNTCNNHGVCESLGNVTKCNCQKGFTGNNCEIENLCNIKFSTKCLNGGTCLISNFTNYTCDCPYGFTGRDCEVDNIILESRSRPHSSRKLFPCRINKCQNGATCIPDAKERIGYFCNCNSKFYGEMCELINFCEEDTCEGHGFCEAIGSTYECHCNDGFSGKHCEINNTCDIAFSTKCLNGGTCIRNNTNNYSCSCPSGYNGYNCEIDNSDNVPSSHDELIGCMERKCQNGGTCIHTPLVKSGYKCYCGSEFYGGTCQFPVGCRDVKCLNGGTCKNKDHGEDYQCICPKGFKGKLCEEKDLCKLDHISCENNGTCEIKMFGEEMKTWCKCDKQFEGSKCENRRLCFGNNCNNHGVCESIGNISKCNCQTGFTGKNCEIENFCKTTFPKKCLNGGVCLTSNSTSYICDCPLDFTGHDCEVDNNIMESRKRPPGSSNLYPCNNNKCQNGATCIPDSKEKIGYTCNCNSKFYGEMCEYKNLCLENTCEGHGFCEVTDNTYMCNCNDGFSGQNCANEVNKQIANCTKICLNGGICSNNGTNNNTCSCLSTFYGSICQFPIACQSVHCLNGGVCAIDKKSPSNIFCNCTPGYEGKHCEEKDLCILKDPKCENNGICSLKMNGFEMTTWCKCNKQFEGPKCENKRLCFGNNCNNHGVCESIGNISKCNCQTGFTGKNCEIENFCKTTFPKKCLNGGVCLTSNSTSYICDCPLDFTGHDCEVDNNIMESRKRPPGSSNLYPCNNNKCQNGATCIPDSKEKIGYTCNCNSKFYGEMCEYINLCLENTCEGHGFCEVTDNTYVCNCHDGFSGQNCENEVNKQIANCTKICLNGGICSNNGTNNNTCSCLSTFYGSICQFPIACQSVHCLNGGICGIDKGNPNIFCNCTLGYGGKYCEQTDLCILKDPNCKNNGTCSLKKDHDELKTWCKCPKEFDGEKCEHKKACTENKCKNHGVCLSTVDGFKCSCKQGFTGINCEIKVNCTKECLNGGTCSSNGENNYTCSCLSNFYGTACELPFACKNVYCRNGGTCNIDTATQDTSCNCPLGYDGKYCEQADLCILNDPKCENNGICSLRKIGFEMTTWCKCNKQFEGPKCENERLCFGNTCNNHGVCESIGNISKCNCHNGFTGKNCETEIFCNTTFSKKCLNGGICLISNSTSYTCECPIDFTGHDCEVNELILKLKKEPTTSSSNPCNVSKCQNGATCIPDAKERIGYICNCDSKFYGEMCEYINLCLENTCEDHGFCEVTGNTYECHCNDGFSGKNCEINNTCDIAFSTKCLNGGTCIRNNTNNYSCSCPSDFNGYNCEIDNSDDVSSSIFGCMERKCQNGGTCIYIPLEKFQYKCYCGSEFYGGKCQFPVGCRDVKCLNGGTCKNKDRGKDFQCICPKGFKGKLCEEKDLCKLDNITCENNGTCKIKLFGGEIKSWCKCPKPFYGEKCEHRNVCPNNTCNGHGVCEDTGDMYTCYCNDGFTGKNCEIEKYCNTTFFTQCLNGGTCALIDATHYVCSCASGFIGLDCDYKDESDVFLEVRRKPSKGPIPCEDNNCQNEATCIPTPSDNISYICNCSSKFYGDVCQFHTGCKGVRCPNNGSCVNQNHGKDFKCTCQPGYKRNNCEPVLCALKNVTCENNGFCSIERDGENMTTWCNCSNDFYGERCEYKNICQKNTTCKNNGVCENINGSFKCHCPPWFTGNNCELEDYCKTTFPKNCLNGGTCLTANVTDYTCLCLQNFTGHNCNIEKLDPCHNITCKHDVQKLQVSKTKCMCQCGSKYGKYWGEHCEYENACRTSPCLNNGTCIKNQNNYTCNCSGGFSGFQCQIRNPCYFENDCENEGICKKIENFQHTCLCQASFYGSQCQYKNSCAKKPCVNGGSCEKIHNTYKCHCLENYFGINCEIQNPCLKNESICLNEGICVSSEDGKMSSCICPPHFIGPKCEVKIDGEESTSTPIETKMTEIPKTTYMADIKDLCLTKYISSCKNGGTCYNANEKSFSCHCCFEWIGPTCNITNPCFKLKCLNDEYKILIDDTKCACKCVEPYNDGSNCSILFPPKDPCKNSNCNNGGICIKKSNNSFYCNCTLGYFGTKCQQRDPCQFDRNKNCLNDATCSRIDNINFKCFCKVPFIGTNCDNEDLCTIKLGECIKNTFPFLQHYCSPCGIGTSSCTKMKNTNNYVCTCQNGYAGKYCEYLINVKIAKIALIGEEIGIEMKVHNYLINDEFELNFGEGESTKLRRNTSFSLFSRSKTADEKEIVFFRHIYYQIGTYLVELYLNRNGERIMLFSSVIKVVDLAASKNCVPVLWLHNLGQLQEDSPLPNYHRRDNITTWAVVHWSCQNPENFTIIRNVVFDWELYRISKTVKPGDCDKRPGKMISLVDKLIPTTSKSLIQFKPWILPYGNYLLCCKSSVKYAENKIIDKILYLNNEGLFSIIVSMPRAVITGPDTQVRSTSDTIVLNGSTSYDPDIPGDGRPQTPFHFRWDCKMTSTTSLCPMIDTTDHTLIIKPGVLMVDKKYTFYLTINAPPVNGMLRFDKTESTVQLAKSVLHKYSLSCVQNCNKKVVANRRMIFKCTCETCSKSQNFTWIIQGLGLSNNENWNQVTIRDRNGLSVYIQIESKLLIELQIKSIESNSTQSMNVNCRVMGDIGFIEKKIEVYLPPQPKISNFDKCTIFPSDGTTLKTAFSIRCDIFVENIQDEMNPPLEYAFYMKLSGILGDYPSISGNGYLFHHEVIASYSIEPQMQHVFKFVLPSGNPTSSYELPLRVEVSNSLGNIKYIDVSPIPRILPLDSTSVLDNIYNNGSSGRSRFLESLTAAEDYYGTLQYILATIQHLTLQTIRLDNQKLARIKNEMLITMTELKSKALPTFRKIEHASNVIYAFVRYNLASISPVCDNVCLSHAASLTENIADELQSYLRPVEIIERRFLRLFKNGVLDDHVLNIGRAGVETAGYLLSKLWLEQQKLNQLSNEYTADSLLQIRGSDVGLRDDIDRDYFLVEETVSNDDFLTSEEFSDKAAHLQYHYISKLAKQLLLTVKLYGDAMVSKRSIVDPPLHIKYKDFLSISIELFHSNSLKNQKFPHDANYTTDKLLSNNYVIFSNDTKVDVMGENELVQVLVIVGLFNPFLEPDDPIELETPIMMVEIKDDYTCLIISPTVNIPHQFKYEFLDNKTIFERILAPFDNTINNSKIIPFKINSISPELLKNKDIKTHHLSVPRGSRIFICINDTRGLNIKVIAKLNDRPTCRDYINGSKDVEAVRNTSTQYIYEFDTEEISTDFNTNTALDYYFSFWPDSMSLKIANLTINSDKTIDINGMFSRFHCISREQVVNSIWEEDCTVTHPNKEELGTTFGCRCKHMSIFGVAIVRTNGSLENFVELELFPELDENTIIPYIVGICLLIYLILFIIFGIWDRHNHVVRPKLIVMADIKRIREDTFYLLLVQTGNNFLAGSTANVCCQLYGEKGRSKEYVLSDQNLDTTRQNGYDVFLVSSTRHLGQLEKIRVWHDNSGHTASWYCRQIIVRDIKTDEFWIFFVNRWLTIYMDHESLICRQPVATTAEVEQYLQNRFDFKRYWENIRENHLWICPMTCAPRSTFLRIERLTCAAGVLFIYMLFTTIFYGTPNESSTALTAEFGVYNFSSHIFWIGIVVDFIGVFCGFIFILLFRRIRRERISAIIVWDKLGDKLKNKTESKSEKVKIEISEIYTNPKKLWETDSEEEENKRWNNLDPDRVMVVGVPHDKINSTLPVPIPIVSVHSTQSEVHPFNIPSTDMIRTERWISEAMDDSHGTLRTEDFVHNVEEKKKKIPSWKRVMDFGLIAQIQQMRSYDPSSFIYQSTDPAERLIEDSIRAECNDAEFENNERSVISELVPVKSLEPSVGDGDMEAQLPNVEKPRLSSRHAKVQTHPYSRGNSSQPMAKYSQSGNVEPTVQESKNEIDPSINKSSIRTMSPFINPLKFTVELGEVDYDYKETRMIPRKYLFLPWIVCIATIVFASIFTCVYGLRYSYVRSLDWCTSLFLAMIFSILFFQPVKILIEFLFTLRLARRNNWKSREELRIFNKFELIWITGSNLSIKVWPLNYQLYMPTIFQPALSGAQIFLYKLNVRRKSRIRKSLINFLVGSIFLIIVMVAGHISRDTMFYQNFRALEDILMLENETHVLENKYAFRNIREDKDFYNYMANVFIPSVHVRVDARGRDLTILRSSAAIRTKNREVILLGVPRIRQLRVKPEAHNCLPNDTLRPYCNEEFCDSWYYSNKDIQDYSEGWRTNINPREYSPGNDFWKFHAEEGLSTPKAGQLNSYDSTGYIAELGRIQSTSLGVLNEMERTQWIDSRTRVIIVEFSAYNPNLNIHSVVALLLERSASLQYITSSQVLTWRFPVQEETNDDLYISDTALIISIIIFSLCLLYFFIFTVVSSIKSFRQKGVMALKKFLLWLDICIIALGITVVWNHFIIRNSIDLKLELLRESAANSYVSFQIKESLYESQVIFFAALTALGICKLWYLLLISNRLFFIIGFTFSVTGSFILGCIFIFLILLLGFCIGACLVFGSDLSLYRTIGHSILTQTYHAGLRNLMPYDDITGIAPIFGRIFFFGFTVFVVLLFINVMASVLTMGLQEAKETSLQHPFRFSYHDYIWYKLQLILPNLIRKKFEKKQQSKLSIEREAMVENVFIPILWNHIHSIPVKRVKEMKTIAENLVKHTELKLVSRKDKELEKKSKILKIEEGRVNLMRELTIRYIKKKLRIEFEIQELEEYDNFNYAILQLKCLQLEKKVVKLKKCIDNSTFDKKSLQTSDSKINQRHNTPFINTPVKDSSDPWESESDSVTQLK